LLNESIAVIRESSSKIYTFVPFENPINSKENKQYSIEN